MKPTYSIRDWAGTFEVSQTRKAKRLNWVAVPTKHDGKGYRRIMRKDPAMYAVWIVLVQVAAKCPERGVLADRDGPLDASDIADATGCPADLIERAFLFLSSPEIGWLGVVNATPSAATTNETTGSTLPADSQHATSPLPADSQPTGSTLELRNVTRRDVTERNETEHSLSSDDDGEHSESLSDIETEFRRVWNATKGTRPFTTWNRKRRDGLRVRLRDPTPWDWYAALAKFPLKCFSHDPKGWQPDVDWFLRPGTVISILEGKYDWSKAANGKHTQPEYPTAAKRGL